MAGPVQLATPLALAQGAKRLSGALPEQDWLDYYLAARLRGVAFRGQADESAALAVLDNGDQDGRDHR